MVVFSGGVELNCKRLQGMLLVWFLFVNYLLLRSFTFKSHTILDLTSDSLLIFKFCIIIIHSHLQESYHHHHQQQQQHSCPHHHNEDQVFPTETRTLGSGICVAIATIANAINAKVMHIFNAKVSKAHFL